MSDLRWEILLHSAIGLVLLGAAVAKVWSRSSARPFLVAFGLPERPAAVLAYAVVLAEAGCGLLLLAGAGAAPAYVAAGLCTGFAVLLSVARLRGVTEGCRCFGALDGTRITPVTVVRALTLALAAVATAVLATGDGAGMGLDRPTADAVLLGALAAATYLVVFALAAEVYGFEKGRKAVQRRIRSTAAKTAPAPAGGSAG